MHKLHYSMEAVLPVVETLLRERMGYDHSSVTYDVARQCMRAVLYVIGLQTTGQEPALSAGMLPATQAYALGMDKLRVCLQELQTLHAAMQPSFQTGGSPALRSAFFEELPAFIRQYDLQFAPEESGLFSYPVLQTDGQGGAPAALAYLRCLQLEQQFLSLLHPHLLAMLADSRAAKSGENLCEAALMHMAGCALVHKPVYAALDAAVYNRLASIVQRQPPEATETLLETLLARLHRSGEALHAYLRPSLPALAARIRMLADHKATRRLFLF